MKDFKSYLSLLQEGDKSSSDTPEMIDAAIDYFDKLLNDKKSHKAAFDEIVNGFAPAFRKALVKKYKFDSDIFV